MAHDKDNQDKRGTPALDDTAIQAYRRAFARSGGLARAQALPGSKRAAIAKAAGVASGAARKAKAMQKAKEQANTKIQKSNASGEARATFQISKPKPLK